VLGNRGRGVVFMAQGFKRGRPLRCFRGERRDSKVIKEAYSGGSELEVFAWLTIDLGSDEGSPARLCLGAATLRFAVTDQQNLEWVIGGED
jgi:hypothetical protein